MDSSPSAISKPGPCFIAIFLPNLGFGGIERLLVLLSRKLEKLNYQIVFVLSEASGEMLSDVGEDTTVIDLNSPRVLMSVGKLAQVLVDLRPDILFSATCGANLVAVMASKRSRFAGKLILSEHSSLDLQLREKNWIASFVWRSLVKWLYPSATSILTVSNGLSKELQTEFGLAGTNMRTIPNPVAVDDIQKSLKERESQPEQPTIIAVGRLSPEKRFDNLIRAVQLVQQKRPCKLEILGEGPERSRLESLRDNLKLSDSVSLPGYSSNPYQKIHDASLLVLSSSREGFGLVLVEAMAVGTPVISTDCPYGPREILGNNIWGRLVPVGDDKAMANAILAELDSPLTKKENLMERANEFAVNKIVDKYIELFESQS